jgi:hypothetical protein
MGLAAVDINGSFDDAEDSSGRSDAKRKRYDHAACKERIAAEPMHCIACVL